MPIVNLSPIFNAAQEFTAGGVVLAGGLLNTYSAGTVTPSLTYTTSAGSVANSNPIQLGPDGRPPFEIWLVQGQAYKFILTDSLGLNPLSFDNISGVNDQTALIAFEALLADTTNAANGDALVGVNNGDANEVGRTLHYWIKARRRNLCSFLTTTEVDDIQSGTGSIDVAAKFNNALATVAALGGKGAALDLPFGLIKVASALTPATGAIWVEGQGRGTKIQPSALTGDIFTVGDGTNECSGLVFSNFDIWPSVTKTAGYVFNCRLTTDSLWENVRAGSIDVATK